MLFQRSLDADAWVAGQIAGANNIELIAAYCKNPPANEDYLFTDYRHPLLLGRLCGSADF